MLKARLVKFYFFFFNLFVVSKLCYSCRLYQFLDAFGQIDFNSSPNDFLSACFSVVVVVVLTVGIGSRMHTLALTPSSFPQPVIRCYMTV